jgi:signal transduction histidine kinase
MASKAPGLGLVNRTKGIHINIMIERRPSHYRFPLRGALRRASFPIRAFPGHENAATPGISAGFARVRLISSRKSAPGVRVEPGCVREAIPDVEATLMANLREANENLVVASMHAQAMTEEAWHANTVKEQFLATLAHELRNPLSPVLNALEVLNRVKSPDPMVSWAHSMILRQVGNMTMLINDLLDISRINSGRIQLEKRHVTIEEVMRQAIEIGSPAIHGRKQILMVDIPLQDLTVDGDPRRLVQVFSNLLNNAGKYTHAGGSILFVAEVVENCVVLRVSDNGCGIEEDALPHVFELFSQEDRSLDRAKGGLGIGLAVARGIVELHGGTISASSGGPGKGSQFEVVLPLNVEP